MQEKQTGIIFKKSVVLLILLCLTLTPHILTSLSALTKTEVISSSGSIEHQTIPQDTKDELHFTGIGEDYLIAYDDPNAVNPDNWLAYDSYRLKKYVDWNMKAARIGFRFADCQKPSGVVTHSTYDEEKMDQVIQILATVGVKPILDLHNVNNDMQEYLGSWNWVNNWKNVARHYKGDERIGAFQIFNEPFEETWATSGPVGAITDERKLLEVCAYLVNEIHNIDPSRIIVFPTFMLTNGVYGWPLNWTLLYNDLIVNGMIQDKVIFDIVHPYYFENSEWDLYLTPSQKAAWYRDNFVIPAVNLLGSNKCWVGETFAWYPATHDKQVQYLTEMINAFVEYDVDFQILSYFAKSYEARQWQDEGLIASMYFTA